MPLRSWILFLCVVLTLLAVIHGFILFHFWPLIADHPLRWLVLPAVIFLGLSYAAGRSLETAFPKISHPLLRVGSWWLGIMVYLFLGCFLLDILCFLNGFYPFLPADPAEWLTGYFTALIGVTAVMMLLGHLNVQFPHVRKLPFPAPAGLRMVVASDLHLCGLVSLKRVRRIVQQINALKPDLILLPGDTVDEDMSKSPRREAFRHELSRLEAPHGILAVTGNHEWISGVKPSCEWLRSCGIQVLQDEAADLKAVIVAGRNDVASSRINHLPEIPLSDILADKPCDKPLIVLDHQPKRIQEAVDAKSELLLCGHTHHGQFWPFQWITQLIFPISHGYRKFSHTNVYVSCGCGAWGPQVRTSSRSEILLIEPTLPA